MRSPRLNIVARCCSVVAALAVSAIALAAPLPSAAQNETPAAEVTPTPAAPLPTPTPPPAMMPRVAPTTPSPTPIAVGRVTAIGDSVMLGAAREMRRSIAFIEIDAAVSRQANAVINLVAARRAAGRLGDVVIVHIGNNGPITTTQFDQLMQPLAAARTVLVVNLRVPRPWERNNNAILAEGVARYRNAILVDWNGLTRANPDLLGGDGTHLGARSARAYTALLIDALAALPRETPEPEQVAPP